MSEERVENPKVSTLLGQLAALAIEEQDFLRGVELRYQAENRRKEVQHREAVAALERARETERDNDYFDCETRKQRIFEDTQVKREEILAELKRAEERESRGASTCIATYPDQVEADFPSNPEPTINQVEQDNRGATESQEPVALVDVIRETAEGEIEAETIFPNIPSQRGRDPRWIPKGTRVWILNSLKLKGAEARPYLQGTVSRHGTVYHFIKIWNPISKKHEEHRRHRDWIALIE